MEFEDIIACLQDQEKRNEYIARLKSAGQNSQPVLDLKNSMEGVNLHKPPKNIFEKTMLQHTFKYCDPLECFLQFRLVCKAWQNAVETIKFDKFNDPSVLELHPLPNFVQKYLQTFKKLKISRFNFNNGAIDWEDLGKIIVKNTEKLNELSIRRVYNQTFTSEQQSFIEQILKKSHKTLKEIYLSKFLFPNIGLLP